MNQIIKAFQLNEVEGVILGLDLNLKSPISSDQIDQKLKAAQSRELFEGKIGQTYSFSIVEDGKVVEVCVLGLGDGETFKRSTFRKGLATAYKTLKGKKLTLLGVQLSQAFDICDCHNRLSRIIGETLCLADYNFDAYKTDAKPSPLNEVWLMGDHINASSHAEGVVLGESTVLGRILTNEPANILTPGKLAEESKTRGELDGFEVEIKNKEEIEALNMHAFMAVARASAEEPKLIVMRYTGNPDSQERLGLVGKGLTYDSGGLSIKPTPGMVTMKCDMGGASSVIGAMSAISRQKLKVNVTAVVAACENMISGVSYKPGDIISSMGGKSIFIGNTDAEGRLTLVDAVTYIQEFESVTSIVDIATLTGAAIHCLGSAGTPMISNDDTFFAKIERSFDKADENAWRMPIFDEYKELIKHEYADLTNTAGSPGTITAGMFIGAFVKDLPWVHIDIAGTAFTDKAEGIFSKGGTGVGVRPLYFLAKKMSK